MHAGDEGNAMVNNMNKTNLNFWLFVTFIISSSSCAQQKHNSGAYTAKKQLIFEEKFDQPLDTAIWRVELQSSPGSIVKVIDGGLQLQTGAGVTVWLNKLLKGNIMITYDRKVIMQNGALDRLSDLNQFWMASDPNNSNLFTRNGKLETYDSLQLYYVGMGGNSNTTTRFRRYDGKGNRELLAEYLDSTHLLKPNQTYHIKTILSNGQVSFWVDDQRYFSYTDPAPLTKGYFGFRSTKSNQLIGNLKIYRLKD